jgi:hypothetical protein
MKFKVEIKPTQFEWSVIYLWAIEGWLFVTEEIIYSESFVPNEAARDKARQVLQDAEKYYQIYRSKPRGYYERKV